VDTTNFLNRGVIRVVREHCVCCSFDTARADLGSRLLYAFDLAGGQPNPVGVKYAVNLGDSDLAQLAASGLELAARIR
jgi:hypothetical protein